MLSEAKSRDFGIAFRYLSEIKLRKDKLLYFIIKKGRSPDILIVILLRKKLLRGIALTS